MRSKYISHVGKSTILFFIKSTLRSTPTFSALKTSSFKKPLTVLGSSFRVRSTERDF